MILQTFGTINTPGYGTMNTKQGLNAPYDAKVLGDYTGLTPPFEHGIGFGRGFRWGWEKNGKMR